MMDIPILRDADNTAGPYVAAKGDGSPWPGANIYSSLDGVTYSFEVSIGESAVFGSCTTTLGDWTGARVFDETNKVRVDLGDGSIASVTRTQLLNDQTLNAFLIGDEILQARDATLISTGVYDLSGLLRGGRGTEWSMTGHVADERCVLLRTAGLRRISRLTSELGVARWYKAVTVGASLSSATPESFTDYGVALKPFSPVDLRAARDSSANISFTWQRRTRLATRTIGPLGISVPLGEDSESYALEIYSDGTYSTVLRTITATSAAASYSAADQTTDGLTPGNTVYLRLYQISATVGRGYKLEQAA